MRTSKEHREEIVREEGVTPSEVTPEEDHHEEAGKVNALEPGAGAGRLGDNDVKAAAQS